MLRHGVGNLAVACGLLLACRLPAFGLGDGLEFRMHFPVKSPDLALVTGGLPKALALRMRGLQTAEVMLDEPDWWEVSPLQICTAGPWGDGGQRLPWFAFVLDITPYPTLRGWIAPPREMGRRPAESWFRWEDVGGERLQLLEGDDPVLAFVYGMVLPEGVPAQYRRSCYVHPLYGLDGEVLSDDFPADHLHHRGLFWRWPHVTVGGQDLDQWACAGAGARFEGWLAQEGGPVCAVLGARSGWYVEERRIVEEEAWLRVWTAGKTGRAIDVCLVLAATDEPVGLGGREGKGYGGFGFRYAPREGPVITAPAGVAAQDSDDQPLAWADESGRFGGAAQPAGVALFTDPGNSDSPNGWCLRHYGYIGVGWPGLGRYTLEPGRPLVLRYRLWVHRGGAEEGQVAAAYAAFAQPPEVALVGVGD